MTRGRCGWLILQRNGLSPSIPCRFLRRTTNQLHRCGRATGGHPAGPGDRISITSEILDLGQALGSEHDVELLLANVIGTKLAPLLTAIVLISRSGSAITVDMGLM